MNMSKSYAFWSVLAITLMFGLGGCGGMVKFLAPPTVTPPPVEARQIVENTLGLHEYWRLPHACLNTPSNHPIIGLATTSSRVACLIYNQGTARLDLQVFDTTHGNSIWKAASVQSTGLESVLADNQRVYLTSMFEIQAYNLGNGQQLWNKSVPIKGGLFQVDGTGLHALEGGRGGPWMFYSFDVQTGDMLNSESVSTNDDFIRLARYPKFDLYFGLTGSSSAHQTLRALNRTTQQILWQVKVPELASLPNWPPVLLDNILLIDTGEKVIALDAQSGQVLWKQGGGTGSIDALFATRAALMGGSLYALRFDGRLLQFDPKTGAETGHIQFAPGLPTSSPHGKFFSLVTDGQMLFVSFDDSQELIVLGP